MGELEDKISSVLGDPAQLAQIRAMAEALMGGSPGEDASGGEGAASNGESARQGAAPAPEALGALLRGGLSGLGGKSPRMAALEALAACLGERRREKLTRAMKLARVLRLAQAGLLSAEGKDV